MSPPIHVGRSPSISPPQEASRSAMSGRPGYGASGRGTSAFGSRADVGPWSDLEADTRFVPVTELTVRRLSGSGPPARFPSAMVNREQVVTLLEASDPESGVDRGELRCA